MANSSARARIRRSRFRVMERDGVRVLSVQIVAPGSGTSLPCLRSMCEKNGSSLSYVKVFKDFSSFVIIIRIFFLTSLVKHLHWSRQLQALFHALLVHLVGCVIRRLIWTADRNRTLLRICCDFGRYPKVLWPGLAIVSLETIRPVRSGSLCRCPDCNGRFSLSTRIFNLQRRDHHRKIDESAEERPF